MKYLVRNGMMTALERYDKECKDQAINLLQKIANNTERVFDLIDNPDITALALENDIPISYHYRAMVQSLLEVFVEELQVEMNEIVEEFKR